MTTSGYFLTRSISVDVDWPPSSSAEPATPLNSILSIRSSSVGKILLWQSGLPYGQLMQMPQQMPQMIDVQLRTLYNDTPVADAVEMITGRCGMAQASANTTISDQ